MIFLIVYTNVVKLNVVKLKYCKFTTEQKTKKITIEIRRATETTQNTTDKTMTIPEQEEKLLLIFQQQHETPPLPPGVPRCSQVIL